MLSAHKAGNLAEKSSKDMDDPHYRSDKVDQLAISVSIFFKLLCSVSE
jgi:hypothetical protein